MRAREFLIAGAVCLTLLVLLGIVVDRPDGTRATVTGARPGDVSGDVTGEVLSGGKTVAGGRPRALFIGDGYAVGNGLPEAQQGWPYLAARRLNWAATIDARAGQGYLGTARTAGGKRVTLVQRIAADTRDADYDFVVLAVGRDDSRREATGKELRRAIGAALAATRDAEDHAAIVVVGPFWPNDTPSAEVQAVDDALRDEAEEVSALFLDPIRDAWVTGNKYNGTGAADRYMLNDVLPSLAGQQHFAARMVAGLSRAGIRPAKD